MGEFAWYNLEAFREGARDRIAEEFVAVDGLYVFMFALQAPSRVGSCIASIITKSSFRATHFLDFDLYDHDLNYTDIRISSTFTDGFMAPRLADTAMGSQLMSGGYLTDFNPDVLLEQAALLSATDPEVPVRSPT